MIELDLLHNVKQGFEFRAQGLGTVLEPSAACTQAMEARENARMDTSVKRGNLGSEWN